MAAHRNLGRTIPVLALLGGLVLVLGLAQASTGPAPDTVEPGNGVLSSPEVVAQHCLADALTLEPEEHHYARYLMAPPEYNYLEVVQLGKVLAFHVNSLSTEGGDPKPPVLVKRGLWRILTRDYLWPEGVWDKLAEVDPYWHSRVEVVTSVVQTEYSWVESKEWPGEVWLLYQSGRQVGAYNKPKGTYHSLLPNGNYGPVITSPYPFGQVVKQTKERRVSQAPWVGGPAVAQLVSLTGTQSPIYFADWFVHQTASSADRVAGYYDFLGIGKAQKDFDKFAGVNPDEAQRRRTEIGDAVRRSSVTLKAREIYRENTFFGHRWTTRDFDTTGDKVAPEDRDNNPLRLLDQKAKNAATEQLATLPNGLLAAWLANGQGVRQDTAPDKVASSRNMPHYRGTDQRVHSYWSCVGCHTESGLRPVDGWVRGVYYDFNSPLQLNSPDYETRKRNRLIYQSSLPAALNEDRVRFARAVFLCNRLSPEDNARNMVFQWEAYAEADWDLGRFARRCWTTPQRLEAALWASANSTHALDPVLGSLLAGKSLRWDDVEPAYGPAMELLRRTGP